MSLAHLTRFLVFRRPGIGNHIGVFAARDEAHALEIARQMFDMPKTAFALKETR